MRLLLVEDDVDLGPQLQAALQRAGYAADLATDGIEAETAGELEPYDLIVLDMGLPKRSGLEVLGNWRNKNMHTPVPRVIREFSACAQNQADTAQPDCGTPRT